MNSREHKAEAEHILRLIAEPGDKSLDTARVLAAIAQVHATLATIPDGATS